MDDEEIHAACSGGCLACEGGLRVVASTTRPHSTRAREYLTVAMPDQQDTSSLFLCDPLTGLVAYPSFEELIIAGLPALAIKGLHLAIGDVG